MSRGVDGRPTGSRTGRDEETPPPIVVGVDGSDSARHAAEWAAEVASAWRAPLHLIHADHRRIEERTSDPAWLRELHDAVERAGVDEVQSRVVPGPAVDELITCSHGAGLVVVGSYGEGSQAGMLAGSAALALLEAAECPVAVIRGAAPLLAPPRRGPVLVGTDGVTDDDALYLGAALAVGFGARLSVLHAWSDVVEDAQGVHRTTASGTELAAQRHGSAGPVPAAAAGGTPEPADRTARRRRHRPARTARAGGRGPRRRRRSPPWPRSRPTSGFEPRCAGDAVGLLPAV